MSIFTDMFPVTLRVNEPIENKSGQLQDNYVFVDTIDIAIYKNSSYKNITNVKYQESTHNGLTYFKEFQEGKEYQVVVGMYKYSVLDYDTSGRMTTVLLKRVDFNG